MKVRTQILLQPEHHAFLKREAAARRLSQSGVIRKLLDDSIASRRACSSREDPVLSIVGKYASGRTDTACRSKDILYGRNGV